MHVKKFLGEGEILERMRIVSIHLRLAFTAFFQESFSILTLSLLTASVHLSHSQLTIFVFHHNFINYGVSACIFDLVLIFRACICFDCANDDTTSTFACMHLSTLCNLCTSAPMPFPALHPHLALLAHMPLAGPQCPLSLRLPLPRRNCPPTDS